MALGTVRGYRTWTMRLPLRSPSGMGLRVMNSGLYGWGTSMDYYAAPALPAMDQSYVEGMFGGHWRYIRQHDGLYQASCGASIISYSHAGQFWDSKRIKHTPPDSSCGCGYWAYWDTRNVPDFTAQRPWVSKHAYGGYEAIIPLSGVIEGSGPTIIGETGFRTARARITDLAVVDTGGCVYEEERGGIIADNGDVVSFAGFGGSYQQYQTFSLTQFLSRDLKVPEHMVKETIYAAVVTALGSNFKWHDTPDLLRQNCPPDENYGG